MEGRAKIKTERRFASVKESSLDQLVKNADAQKETPQHLLLFTHRNATPMAAATVKAKTWISEKTDVILEEPTTLVYPTHVKMEELVRLSTLTRRTCASVRTDSQEPIVKRRFAHQVTV